MASLISNRREQPKSALYLRFQKRNAFKIVKGETLWAFWNSSLLQNWRGTLWSNPKISEVSEYRKNPSEIHQDSQRGSLVCFRSSGRRFFCFRRGSDVSRDLNLRSSSCWTNEQKSGPYASKKLPTVRVGLISSKASTKNGSNKCE